MKNIYDQIPGLQVIYTGSSILDLEKGGADLSRRKVEYRLPGLSFREYLNISQGWQLPSYSLEEILAGKVEFPYKEARPLKLFNDYLSTGYYPFFQDTEYLLRLRSVINQMVESDIPIFADMTVASAVKLKKLLYVLAQVSLSNQIIRSWREIWISAGMCCPTTCVIWRRQVWLIYCEKKRRA